jgi:hypothetical protein
MATGGAAGATGLLYEERLRATPRSWLWCLTAVAITFLAIAPIIVPVTLVAWCINVGRYHRITIRIDDDYVWVGHRWARLATLDLATLGRAQNTWPWRSFNNRYLGANPIWTRDSVGLRGVDSGKKYWLSVGTNHRDELIGVLTHAIATARERVQYQPVHVAASTLPPPAWHPDPWDPVRQLRWWDGTRWTGHTWSRDTTTREAATHDPAIREGRP